MLKRLLTILIILTALLILGVTFFNANKHRPVEENEPISENEVGVDNETKMAGGEADIQGHGLVSEELDIQEVAKVARASWYGQEVCGTRYGTPQCKTASGEIFDETKLTFASRFLEFGTRVEFCYGGSCVVCRRTDYGPAVWTNRTFDLNRACFDSLADLSKGVINVEWKIK